MLVQSLPGRNTLRVLRGYDGTTAATAGDNSPVYKAGVTLAYVTDLAESLTSAETSVDVDDATNLAIGSILLVENEQMRVTSISGNTLTVTRGYGTTAVSHADGLPVSLYTITHVHQTQLDEAVDASETGIDVDDGDEIAIGDILQVQNDAELMLVTAIASDTLTVTRGYGGTTAETHSDNHPVYVHSYTTLDLLTSITRLAFPGITAAATGITVNDATNIAVNDVLRIDEEHVQVTAITGNVLTVTRAHDSTTAAVHVYGADVFERTLVNFPGGYIVVTAATHIT